jgi:drug/metabolite transporter (DMT)-like permease
MTHRRAVALMVGVTLLWSIAGVITRQLEAARGFEVTFWRSFFTAVSLLLILGLQRGSSFWPTLRRPSRALWVSGAAWGTMFSAFMLALTLTTVANVLVTMALAPLVTALFSRFFLGRSLPLRTWLAIATAGSGIAWMFGSGGEGLALLGTLVACLVPLAAAINLTVLQRAGEKGGDLVPAVFIGACLSALAMLPLAWPLATSAHDLALLALLGSVQLALPCVLMVVVSRTLPAPEIALLALLEVVFGVAWAWLWAGEQPAPAVLGGGLLVLAALVANETLALREK